MVGIMQRVGRSAMILVVTLGWVGHNYVAADVVPEPATAWVIESADYQGDVHDQVARLEALYTIRIMRDGWVAIPLAIPGATITGVQLKKKIGDAQIVPQGASYALAASRKGEYAVRITCSALLVRDSESEGVRFGIPQAAFSTMTLFVPRQDVELQPQDQLYVERHPERGGVRLLAHLGVADQATLRWRTKPSTPVIVEPVIYGEVHSLVTIEEQLAHLTTLIDYRIAQGETKTLAVRLPSGINILNVRGAGVEDWKVRQVQDDTLLTVALNFALKDTTYRLIIEGEQAIPDGSASYQVAEVRLHGVKQERGDFAIARTGSIELMPTTVEGMNRIDVRELPDILRSAAHGTTALAFKYHQHPYRMVLGLTHHQDHAVLAAIAERGDLSTVISAQGELLTRANYFIKANKKQYVSVVLPNGATLWSCLVDGASVKPVEGKTHELLVPLTEASERMGGVFVELVYFEHRPQLARFGRLHLQGPVLDVPTTVANWTVYTSRGVKFLRTSGNLDQGQAAFDFLDEPFVQVASAAQGTTGFEVGAGGRGDDLSSTFDEGKKESRLAQLKDFPRRMMRKMAYNAAKAPEAPGVYRENGSVSESDDDKRLTDALAASRPVINELEGFVAHAQETGILPLKIRIPKLTTAYRFSRLMTSQDPLRLDMTYAHLESWWLVCALLGLFGVVVASPVVARAIRR